MIGRYLFDACTESNGWNELLFDQEEWFYNVLDWNKSTVWALFASYIYEQLIKNTQK